MTLDEYFQMRDTPMKQSPVGLLMQRILEETPDLSFEDARRLAQTQLVKASGKRNYTPRTPGQERATSQSLRRRFSRTLEIATTAA